MVPRIVLDTNVFVSALDEADNHVVELAVAVGAIAIVTYNTQDFARAELHFPGLRIVRPTALVLEE